MPNFHDQAKEAIGQLAVAQGMDHQSALGRIANLEEQFAALNKGISQWMEQADQRLSSLERELGVIPNPKSLR